jgi:hypothetical protein
MRILFIASVKKREKDLAEAFCAGVRARGDHAEWTCKRVGDMDRFGQFDAVAMVGVKSRKFWEAAVAAGAVPIMLDKGYVRDRQMGARVWKYWRVSIGAHQPIGFFHGQNSPSDRWDALGLDVKDWTGSGSEILLAGSSAKFHEFSGLGDPTKWAKRVIKDIGRATDHKIVYRPKPSWREAVPIERAEFSGGKDSLADRLANALCIVTYGSNISFEGVLNGVPSIVLGMGIARPISSCDIGDVAKPFRASDKDRMQWLQNVAYWQWTEDEMRTGAAWDFLRSRVELWRAF